MTTQNYRNDVGDPLTCDEFVDDGWTRLCARCGWWRSSHEPQCVTFQFGRCSLPGSIDQQASAPQA